MKLTAVDLSPDSQQTPHLSVSFFSIKKKKILLIEEISSVLCSFSPRYSRTQFGPSYVCPPLEPPPLPSPDSHDHAWVVITERQAGFPCWIAPCHQPSISRMMLCIGVDATVSICLYTYLNLGKGHWIYFIGNFCKEGASDAYQVSLRTYVLKYSKYIGYSCWGYNYAVD